MIERLVHFSVVRPVTVFMVALAILAFGAVSLSRLSLNLLPDISYPSLTVQTEYANAAPAEVENLVTKPVEEAVGVLKGLKEIHSVSRAGMSEVTLEFGWSADMDMLSMDIREKLDRLLLPDEAENPIVLRYDPALDPIMRISVSGDGNLVLMRYIAERTIKEALEKIEGVASAQIKGGEEEEIQINLNQGKVSSMGISPEQLAQILTNANINRPGGSLKGSQSQYLVRTLNEFEDTVEIGNLTITPAGVAPVRLADVAEVIRGVKDREEITRVNGQESVLIEIFKEGDANTVQVARAVRAQLDILPRRLPKDMALSVLSDQSRFIVQSIREVQETLLIGGALAILVLLFFLWDIRATLIVATSIPLSVIFTFILMYRMDVSLNMMSLGGLTLGIGMLVDASIVVLESIHRQRERGLSRSRAAIVGTSQVGGAVIASVLTTIAVFFPIVFVEGIAGEMFRDQSLTVTFSLLASLIVSLSLIPMMSSLGRKVAAKANSEKVSTEKKPVVKEAVKQGRLSALYERVLRISLAWKWVTIAAAFGVFFLTLRLVPSLGTELIPALSEGEFFFEVTLPEGSSLPATDRVIAQMEMEANARDEVDLVYASVGSRSVSGGISLKTRDENLGQVNVVMKQRDDQVAEERLAEALREQYEHIPNLQVKLGRPSFFSLKTPVELLFFGEDLEELRDYTLSIKNEMAAVEGLRDLRASMEAGNPELTIVFDRDKLARLGLNIGPVSETLRSRIDGQVVSRLNEGDRQIDIRLRNRERDRDSVLDIENTVVANLPSGPVTLKSIATVENRRGPAEIHRIQQSRVGVISADLSGRSLGVVMEDVAKVVAENPPPPGILFELGGQNREMETSFDSLKFAIILAIFLVYLVMAATFENLVHPFIILFSIPLALIGVILGLYYSGNTISVIALIGVVFLCGVVVNNAIVLIDAVNRARREGVAKLEAVVSACKLRMRPILMTTMTTVLGLLPMALGLGEGAELRQPLAVVVSTGLIISTFLTLFVIPAIYLLVPSKVRTFEEDEELAAVVQEALAMDAPI